MASEQAQAESEVPPIERGQTQSSTNLIHSAFFSLRCNRLSWLRVLLLSSLMGPLSLDQPVFADVSSDGLGTWVNGGLAGHCSSGDCKITGGIDAGMNRFLRLLDFDTRGAITSVQIDSGSQNNVVLGVTSPLGSFINKSVTLSSPAHLFLLSPGGIYLGSGANFVNTPNLTLSTANRLKFASGVFDVHNTTVDQLAALGGAPLPGSLGLHRSIEVDDGNVAPNQIILDGIDILIDQSLFVDAPSGGVKVIGSNLSVGDSAHKGGTLTLTGEIVDVDGYSLLDVAGASGGGTIHLGGSWQNSDPSVRQAVKTTVASGAVLDASATQSGDGGEIVVWSDIKDSNSITDVKGSLIAKGGIQSGQGGRVETSGYGLIVEGIHVDTRSFSGTAGDWLLDPWNIEIKNVPDDKTSNVAGVFTATGGTPAVVYVDTIQTQLATTNVTVQTTAGTGLEGEPGNITVSDPITQNGSNKLTLDAYNDIILNASITRTGDGGIQLNAGNDILIGADITASGFSQLGFNAGNDILTTAAAQIIGPSGSLDFTLDAANIINLQNDITRSGTGNIFVTSSSATGSIQLTTDGSITHSGSGDVSFSSVNEITLTGDITQSGGGDVSLLISNYGVTGPGDINMGSSPATLTINQDGGGFATSWSGNLTGTGAAFIKTGTGSLSLSGDHTYSGDTSIDGGSLVVTGSLSDSSNVKVGSGGIYELGANDAVSSISGAGQINLGSYTLSAGNSGNQTFSGSLSGAGGLTKTGTGSLNLIGDNSFAGAVSINQGTLQISHESALGNSKKIEWNDGTLRFSIDASDDPDNEYILNNGGGTLEVDPSFLLQISGVISGPGGLTKTGTGSLSLSGANTYSGDTSVDGGSLVVTGSLSDSSDVKVGSGGIYELGANDAVNSFSGAGQIDLGSYALSAGNSNNQTFSGALSGSGGLTKTGTGTLELTNNNLDFTGTVLVSDGVLTVTGINPLAENISCSGGTSNQCQPLFQCLELSGCAVADVVVGGGGSGSDSSQKTDAGGLTDLQNVLLTEVNLLLPSNQNLLLPKLLNVVGDDDRSQNTAYKPTEDINMLVASGSKSSMEGVDVSIGESFVVEDFNEGDTSDAATTSDSSGDESSDSPSRSEDSGDSESSDGQSSSSIQEDGDSSSLQLVAVDPPSAVEVLSRLSSAINVTGNSVSKALGLSNSTVPNITLPQIQRSLLQAIQKIRNVSP